MSTNSFEVGDLVQCVDVRDMETKLILGECYEVIEAVNPTWVVVKDLQRQTVHVTKSLRFELVTPAGGWKEDEEEEKAVHDNTNVFTLPDGFTFAGYCSHPKDQIVQSHALGQFFNYCRACKQEVE